MSDLRFEPGFSRLLAPVLFLLFRFGFFVFFASPFASGFEIKMVFVELGFGLRGLAGFAGGAGRTPEGGLGLSRLLMTAGTGLGVGAKLGGVLVPYKRSTQRCTMARPVSRGPDDKIVGSR